MPRGELDSHLAADVKEWVVFAYLALVLDESEIVARDLFVSGVK